MRDNSCTAGPFEKQNILPDRPSASTPRRGATHEGVGGDGAQPRVRYRDQRGIGRGGGASRAVESALGRRGFQVVSVHSILE